MTESLDDIMSGRETVSEQQPNVEQQQVASPPEQVERQQPQQVEADQNAEPERGQKTVPHEALHAEKQKTKRYTEEVSALRQEIADRDAAWERRIAAMMEATRQPPQQPQQQQPVDWWSDPETAFRQNMEQAFNPYAQQLNQLHTQVMRMNAVQVHGADKVKAFEEYAEQAMRRNDPELVALSAQMRGSPDPIGVALQWFERKSFDPNAERERIREEIMKEIQSRPAQTPPQAPAQQQLPTSFATARNAGPASAPVFNGPRPLSEIMPR